MQTQFNILRTSRELMLKTIEGLTLEQLHTIPKGVNNHIAWNIAHLVVTQQLLHYALSDKDLLIPDDLVKEHRKGASVTKTFNQEEWNEVLELLMGLPDTLEEDYKAAVFKKYNSYKTSVGFVLDSLETAITFNNYHEGLHLGIIMSLKKLV